MHFIKYIVFIFILLSALIGHTETPEQLALDAVQKNYEKVLTFEAKFTQNPISK